MRPTPVCSALLLLWAAAAWGGQGNAEMTAFPAGQYRPFFKAKGGARPNIPVRAFYLDPHPVTRAEYADFVLRHPAWRKSAVKPLFAESAYLSDWAGDDPGGGNPGIPVTYVSWFAARAFCECQGKRLPTLAEWEMAAAQPARGARSSASGGIGRAMQGGEVWEWIADFDSPAAGGNLSASLFCGAGARSFDPRDYGAFLRYSFRGSLRADYALKNLGFRCARNGP